MSSLGSPSPFLIAGKKSYTVNRSIRGDDNQSSPHRLTRTIQSGGNRKKFTISVWIKRSQLGNTSYSNSAGNDGQTILHTVGEGNRGWFKFDTDDTLGFDQGYDSGGSGGRLTTTAKYRDTSAWYHILAVVDYANSTAADRAKIFVNGVRQEVTIDNAFTDTDGKLNDNQQHEIGYTEYGQGYTGSSWWFNLFCGYMAEYYFIDGQALDPTSFTETNAATGQLLPKEYTGSFGTTGWYLEFKDNSAVTATTLGKDSSGNSNNWTPNGFSVSSGVNNDSLEDTPTLNYPTLNSNIGSGARSGATPSNGNLDVAGTDESTNRATFVFGPGHITTGKWYWEVTSTGGTSGQRAGLTGDLTGSQGSSGVFFRQNNLSWFSSINYKKYTQTSETSDGSYSTGDVIGIAYSADDGEIQYYKNGSLALTDDTLPSVSTTELHIFIFATNSGSNGWPTGSINFGQRAFAYTPPTGYKKLNSVNLPDPTIKKPNQYFDTLLYSGNGSQNRAITGLNFKPDWVWLKSRTNTYFHQVHDTVRGTSAGVLYANNTDAEDSTYGLGSFDSNGFTVYKDGNNDAQNDSGQTYVVWNWDAGETDSKTYTVTVVNDGGNKYRFDGYGTSAVTLSLAKGGTYTFNYPSAHPLRFSTTSDGTHGGGSEYTSGVSTYGNSITITVAANAPTLYYYCSQHSGMGGAVNTNSTLGSSNFDGTTQAVVKANTTAGFSIVTYTGNGSNSSTVGHGLGVTPDAVIIKRRDGSGSWIFESPHTYNGRGMYLNETNGSNTAGTDTTSRSSTLVTFVDSGDTNRRVNINGETYVMYCFSNVNSYSKIGKYTGNGSSDGTFIFTGFRPAWIMIKKTSGSSRWQINDIKRNPENVTDALLFAEDSIAESASSSHNMDLLSNGFKHRNTEGELNGNGSTFIYLAFAEAPFKYARAR